MTAFPSVAILEGWAGILFVVMTAAMLWWHGSVSREQDAERLDITEAWQNLDKRELRVKTREINLDHRASELDQIAAHLEDRLHEMRDRRVRNLPYALPDRRIQPVDIIPTMSATDVTTTPLRKLTIVERETTRGTIHTPDIAPVAEAQS